VARAGVVLREQDIARADREGRARFRLELERARQEYLDARTAPDPRGDYYLGRDGEPTEAAGRWLASTTSLRELGIATDGPVERGDLVSLMEGRAAGSTRDDERFLRPAGADGTRAAGIDVTFSAPKSLSIAWALAEGAQRGELEGAHARAVERAVQYLRATVPTTVSWDPRMRTNQPALARDLLAAEFVHTTARGVGGGAPDPQLHSHVVVTSVVREDGRVAAVRSRPILRAAREVGAYYRAQLAHELRTRGDAIEAETGKRGRYFELVGVGAQAREAFSHRSRQVATAAERFRASHGRAPERGELRALKLHSRAAKAPATRPELEREWRTTAAEHGLEHAPQPWSEPSRRVERAPASDRVEHALTLEHATFGERELRATVLERAPGELGPEEALALASEMLDDGRVLALANGRFTTRDMRTLVLTITDRLIKMASDQTPDISEQVRDNAIASVEERLGSALSDEQRSAVARLAGPGRAAVLIGRAGTGKGVVLDAVAQAERDSGRGVAGVALGGATAERLGSHARRADDHRRRAARARRASGDDHRRRGRDARHAPTGGAQRGCGTGGRQADPRRRRCAASGDRCRRHAE
jgi:conjugative relaxase-like TrwC/TraI family protein